MKKDIFRIVKDRSCGYNIQIKRWWFPFWLYIGFRCITLEEAEDDVKLLINNRLKSIKKRLEVIKYID